MHWNSGDDDEREHSAADSRRAQKTRSIADARARSLVRPKLWSPPKGRRTRPLSDKELLARTEARFAALYSSGKIQVIAGREYAVRSSVFEEREKLIRELDALRRKLGPTRVGAGILWEIQRRGCVYRLAPYDAYTSDFYAVVNWQGPTRGRHALRDRVVWLLWHFRDRAAVTIGRSSSKRRRPLKLCTSCGEQISSPRPFRCRACGGSTFTFKDIEVAGSRTPRITKVYLRQRFKLSRRELDRILAAVPTPPPSE